MDRWGRPRIYTPDVKAALLEVWEAGGCICSKWLAPFRDCVRPQAERNAQAEAGNGETPCADERGHHRPPPWYPLDLAEKEAKHT